MPRARTFAAVALLIGGALAAGYLLGRRGGETAGAQAGGAGSSQDLTRRQANLALAAQALATAPRPAAPAAAGAQPNTEDPVDPVPRPTPQQEADWLVARAKNYDEAMAREPRKEAWAAPLERRAREAYPPVAGKTKLLGIECRSTSCRVALETPEGLDRGEEVQQLVRRFPELESASYAYPGEPKSHAQAVVYLMVDGHELPKLDYASYATSLAENTAP